VNKLPRKPRLRHEEGFTLVELLIAMIVLTVGILALVAAYSSGYAALNRATRVSSARLVADQQMERFRAVQYSAIKLNTTCGASCTEDATFTGDPAYSSAAQVTGCATTDSTCLPTSPSLSCGSGNPYPVKSVTVVVRSSALTASVREQSTFTTFPGN
jgi:prepilin-type N-terminal cleavage/methylation domain-containing protein